MATTTNYSWSTPDDTALVKDGAAAIRSLGTAIDSTVFTNAGAAIAKTIVDAKGDLIVATAADTVARLASSASNGDLLTVDTSTASGLKWAAPSSGGGMTLLQSLSLSGASTTSSTFTPASYKSYYIVITDTYAVGNTAFQMRLNTDTGSNYYRSTMGLNDTTFAASRTSGGNLWLLATIGALSANGEKTSGVITINRINDTTEVSIQSNIYTSLSSNADVRWSFTTGTYNNSAAISSITFLAATNDFSAGTAYIYGVN